MGIFKSNSSQTGMALSQAGICGSICLLIFVLVSLCLFISSFDTVDIDRYGLQYNTWVMEVHAAPQGPGRYFVGIQNDFITFPRALKSFEFKDAGGDTRTLTCWSNNGLNVYIELSYYYLLRPDKLKNFYLEFGPEWEQIMLRISQATIKDTTVQYSATDYFIKRLEIRDNLYKAVEKKLYDATGGSIQVTDL